MRVFFSLWRALPESFRRQMFIQRIKNIIKPIVAGHNDIYTDEYFLRDVDPDATYAAPIVAKSIIDELRPKRAIDVGCGTGALLRALQDSGCSCLGLEYADAALDICRSRGLDVMKFDIEHDKLAQYLGPFDVTISMEVAEHLPEKCADSYVGLLSTLSPILVLTAATPGQGGTDHVNEQPHEYWIRRFADRGFVLDRILSDKWRSQWDAEGIVGFYHKNIMVFRGN